MKKNYRKGFTLVELVVVVAILGILVAVVTPVFSGYIEKTFHHSAFLINSTNSCLGSCLVK